MTIKIVKTGVLPNPTYQGTCDHCKGVFMCVVSDGKYVHDDRECTGWVDIRCPTTMCGRTVHCYELKIPKHSTQFNTKD